MLWIDFVREIRWYWEESEPLPRVPGNGTIDLSSCILHQKLQMVLHIDPLIPFFNLLIEKKDNKILYKSRKWITIDRVGAPFKYCQVICLGLIILVFCSLLYVLKERDRERMIRAFLIVKRKMRIQVIRCLHLYYSSSFSWTIQIYISISTWMQVKVQKDLLTGPSIDNIDRYTKLQNTNDFHCAI